MTTVALIPTFQPNSGLFGVLDGLRQRGIHRIVVDDGSGLEYRSLFRRVARNAIVLTYSLNCGKGHALKLGLRYIQEHYPQDTVVVTVDGDGQHQVADTVRCAQAAEQNPHTMVLGCRSFDGENVPWRSRIGNKITRLVYGATSGTWVSDTQTGLRAFTADLISLLVDVSGERYEYEMNVLLACPEHEVGIREVQIQTVYEAGNPTSHFRPVRDSLRIYAGILWFASASFASFAVDYALFGALVVSLSSLGVAGVLAANVLARVVSAAFNYTLNRTVVFHSEESVAQTAGRYAALAVSLLAANTLMLGVLTQALGVPALAAKLLVEVALFVASWLLQNRVVFRRKRR
ncbi:MAG: bifunctional glycosyltransferase family 2/GtrA family protein [Coriobacteriales bacterium]|nr:bifunctional glycosyltransferase family 2/GtrA family protein [Coriobacteriales bacterium]